MCLFNDRSVGNKEGSSKFSNRFWTQSNLGTPTDSPVQERGKMECDKEGSVD